MIYREDFVYILEYSSHYSHSLGGLLPGTWYEYLVLGGFYYSLLYYGEPVGSMDVGGSTYDYVLPYLGKLPGTRYCRS